MTDNSKPRIRRLVDDYAKDTNQFWACSNGVFIARGNTPAQAYKKFQNHLAFLRANRLELTAREIKGFA